jgi:hypothetical protein
MRTDGVCKKLGMNARRERVTNRVALLKCADWLSHLTIIIIKANLLPHVTALLLVQPSPPLALQQGEFHDGTRNHK